MRKVERPDPQIYGDNQTLTPTGQPSFRLTREARDQLPDEAFCGPNRTFPVPDSRHVGPALGRLRNYAGPSEEADQIRQCILQKREQFDREAGHHVPDAPMGRPGNRE